MHGVQDSIKKQMKEIQTECPDFAASFTEEDVNVTKMTDSEIIDYGDISIIDRTINQTTKDVEEEKGASMNRNILHNNIIPTENQADVSFEREEAEEERP